jgi:hypothetical protein
VALHGSSGFSQGCMQDRGAGRFVRLSLVQVVSGRLADGETIHNGSEAVRSRPIGLLIALRLKEVGSRHVRIRLTQSNFGLWVGL